MVGRLRGEGSGLWSSPAQPLSQDTNILLAGIGSGACGLVLIAVFKAYLPFLLCPAGQSFLFLECGPRG